MASKTLLELRKLAQSKSTGGEGKQGGSSAAQKLRELAQQAGGSTKAASGTSASEKLRALASSAETAPKASFSGDVPQADEQRREQLSRKLRASEEQFRTAETTLQRAEEALQSSEQAMQGYLNNPTEANRTAYEQAYGAYQEALRGYEQMYDRYSQLYTDYELDAVRYDRFMNQNKAAYDSWRGSIRDTETVRAELEDLAIQIKGQEARDMWDGTNEAASLREKQALLQQELEWSEYLRWADLMGNADFADRSGYVSTANGRAPVLNPMSRIYSETGFDDLKYDYINRNPDALSRGMVNDVGGGLSALGIGSEYLKQMTDEEIALFNYIYATQSPETAYSYIAYLSTDLNARQRLAQQAQWTQYAREAPVRSSIFSALMAPVKGLSYVGQFADLLGDGKIDQNAGYNKFSYIPTAIRQEVSSKWGPVGSFAYNTGMSMADFLTTTAAGMGNPTFISAMMGSGAAADTVIDAKDRGLSDGQAFALGTIASLAEGVTEKFSIEALLDADVLKDSLIKYIGKNAFTEATEEGSSNIINFMADVLISQDKSQWQQSINAYKEQGNSDSKAFALAMRDQAMSLGLDALGGAISGGILGGGGAAIQGFRGAVSGSKVTDTELSQLIREAAAAKPDSAAYQMLQKLQKKLETGQTLSAYDKGLLQQAVELTREEANSQAPANLDMNDSTQEETGDAAAQEEFWAGIGKQIKDNLGLTEAEGGEKPTLRERVRGIIRKIRGDPAARPDGTEAVRREIKEVGAMLSRGEITQEEFEAVTDELGEELIHENGMVREEVFPEAAGLRGHRKAESDALAKAGQEVQAQEADPAVWEERPMTAQEAFQKEINDQIARNMGIEKPAQAKAAASVDGQAEYDGGMRYGEGNNVSDGDPGRDAGTGTGKQTGSVSGRTAGQRNTAIAQAKASVQRQNAARDLLQKGLIREQSSRELGIASGTDSRKTVVLPEEYYDDALEDLAHRIEEETGCRAVFTVGGIEIRGADGRNVTVRGVFSEKQIILQADHKIDPERLADHEIFHHAESQMPGLVDFIREQLDEAEFDRVMDRYLEALWSVYGCEETAYDEYEEAYGRIREEVLADAYAGINAFSAGATRFTEDVRRVTGEMGMGTGRQENGVRQTDGPPGERYSYGGEKAATADLDALNRAKQMQEAGVANETIRQQTGWFRGMDGKWRWEIDDSSSRISGDISNYMKLKDLLLDSEILRQYPDLGEIDVTFHSMDSGYNGSYNHQFDSIDLNRKLMGYPEDIRSALLHEVQHAIQAREGFTKGASLGMWKKRIHAGFDSRRVEDIRKMREVEQELRRLQEEEPEFYRDMLELDAMSPDMPRGKVDWDTLEQIEEDPPEWQAYDARREALEEKYGDTELWDFIDLLYKREQLNKRAGRTAEELYWDTAGEIEARDVAGRRYMNAQQRKNTPPRLGDENTVFSDAEGTMSDYQDATTEQDKGLEQYRGKSLVDDKSLYDFDFLSSLPDMKTIILPSVDAVRDGNQKVDREKAELLGMENAKSVGIESQGKVYVQNVYTGRMLRIDNSTIQHGLDGDIKRLLTNARLGSVIGEVVKNAVPINSLVDEAKNVTGTYVMGAYATDDKGREFVATVTVEQRNGQVSEIGIYDVAHALNGRQKRGTRPDTKSLGIDPITHTSDISIRDFLEVVKDTFQAVLSDDVLLYFNEPRYPHGYYSDRVMYSVDDSAPKAGEGFLRTDEAEDEARLRGYPVLNYRQVVPFKTWVRASDRGNYGLVVGMGADQKLIVAFHNKAEDSRGTVAIPYDMLPAVDGQYQIQGDELTALLQSEPVNPNSIALSEQERKEINELFVRAGGFQKSETGGQAEELTVYSRKQVEGIRKAFRAVKSIEGKILRDIKGVLGAHRLADRAYLKDSVQELADEYLRTGTVSQETMDRLFKDTYERGIVIDRELHNQYQDVKKHLNTQAVTISEKDKADITDYNDFRRRTMGCLRIVNEGGLPVDTFYGELRSMAPGLFPENITHPADQLRKLYEVAKSLQISERNLSDYHGEDAAMYRSYLRHEFEVAVWDSIGSLSEVRRYLDDKQAQKEEFEKPPTTEEEAAELWTKLKEARKAYEKAMAKNLLTAADEIQVGRLLRGELLPEQLDPEAKGTRGILAVYEGKKEYCRLMDLIGEYKRSVKGKLRKDADGYLETAGEWKDKDKGLLYSRETMERNIEDIVKDPKLAKKINAHFFEPIRDAEAAATRMKNDYRKRVRDLKLSRKAAKGNLVSEAHAVQLYGEAVDNIRMLEATRGRVQMRDGKTLEEWRAVVDDLWLNNPGLDKGRIETAVQEFRKIYDELFQQMNKVRIRWGYEPVNYRNGYFPHFQPGDGDGILQRFGKALGIDTQVVALPTTINGLTHTFKPGIQWFGNAQERLGFNTAYDAVEGFDKYIEGIASVIHQTENIQKLRALAAQVRYRTTKEGIQKQVDDIYARDDLDDADKDRRIKELYENGEFSLGKFVVELDEYTNLLANKKSKLDRTVEALIGRRFYTCMKWLEARVGANMIAGNLTSAFTNFIPLTQAGAQVGYRSLLKGMWQTLAAYRSGDGMVGMSSFLTNRMGSDPLVQTWSQKVSNVLGKPMELIDGFVSGSIVRAAYEQNLKQGMPESEAAHQADILAARVMAERSKGGMPTLFSSTNPLFKLFTQFQLEVNNQFSEVFKDLPRAYRDKAVAALVVAFLKYFLGAWLFNELYEKLIGRRPALDPIDILVDLGGDLFGENAVGIGEAGTNFATAILEELPFSSGLGLIGVELDGGRIPVSSAIPDLSALWDAATNTEWAPEKRWQTAQNELNSLAYLLPPFAGNQISKIWKGAKAYFEGGSYSVNSKGEDILQYPVHNDENGDFWKLIQSMILGKSSLPEAQEWVEDGFDSLTPKQTAVYQDMLDAGVSSRDAYGLIDDIRAAEDKLEALQDADVSGEAKAVAFYGLLASDKERELMDVLDDIGADPGTVTSTLVYLHDADGLKGMEKYGIQADVLNGSALTEEEKQLVIGSWLGTEEVSEEGNLTQYGKFLLAMKSGISTYEYLQHRRKGGSVDDLLEYTEKGMAAEDASELSLALDALEPEEGEKYVSSLQKWRVCVDFPGDPEHHLTSLSAVMNDTQFEKVELAWKFGVKPELYVWYHELRERYNTDGNSGYTQAEVTATIDAMGDELTKDQKAALWQIVTGSKKAANNPYNVEVGQKVLDAKS